VAALAQGCIKENLPSGAAIWTLKHLNGKMVHFPGLESNTLYVRACYPVLNERKDLINELKKEGRSSNNVVIGIPGIGKSSFGIYGYTPSAVYSSPEGRLFTIMTTLWGRDAHSLLQAAA
jgi:hypothetical protein